MGEATDEYGVFDVRTTGDVVDGVTVDRSWRRHYDDPVEFCATLTETILAALPPDAPEPADDEVTVTEPDRLRGFWNEFMLWQRKLEKLRERARAGELPVWRPPASIDDPGRRWIVEFDSAGKFCLMGIVPAVFDDASAASLSALISEALRDVHLDQRAPVLPEMAEINEHRARFERYLAG
ncbi:hypothetical protein [Amycolatopsis suaedae]|uniref:Uncharacterized protein n=1 Tax=Amycolatopsis suaedae TaxID=2510978 RepID=A0A4Q7J3A7_9PSEU|nr:hypothetical protein [Amycolatopsis suaedae]RZQ61437.1 hypothetical protein EWH70_23965 [Amycolatopsis suaedae]